MEQFLAFVAVENVAYHFDIFYAYSFDCSLKDSMVPGMRVLVPFGKGKASNRQGVIFEIKPCEDVSGYKNIVSALDESRVITDEMLEIARFLKERTFCTYFDAVRVQLPSGLSYKTAVSYFAVADTKNTVLTPQEDSLYKLMLTYDGLCDRKNLYDTLGFDYSCEAMEKLVNKGLVKKNYDALARMGSATHKKAVLLMSADEAFERFPKLTAKQKSVIRVLNDIGKADLNEVCYFTGVTASVVSNLCKKGITDIIDEEYYRIPKTYESDTSQSSEIILTEKQNTAYTDLVQKYKNGGGVSLLYGITGSGKTSVFLKLIDQVISDGKQIIVMVPEIALTPQMMSIFKGRYGDMVAIFHSGLSAGERRDEYKRVFDKKARIAVGTRSAVFAPFDNIGLIVIDEEQEHTYKSESSPKYHAREVARFRAIKHKALLLLASATPSLSSFSRAKKGNYSLEVLDERYGDAVLPEVTVVDMKQERKSGNKYNISSPLLEMLEKNLNDKKQSILLINRRGFNTFAACDECGKVLTCPSCSISLTYHSANNRLMCHYCGYSTVFTKKCPECNKDAVRYAGYGTQRIEKELQELLPEARVIRLDTDSTATKHSFEKALTAFGSGEYDIMLGTQMVAKGLNFENVTLVGVINADQQLNNDDFRSGERTFDLLTQVIGRSGRGKFRGNAVIQTLTPENNVIRLAERQDYDGFYNSEIVIRKIMVYPPFCDMCAVSFVSKNEINSLNASKDFLCLLKAKISEAYTDEKIIVLGPMPPRVSKINNKFIYRLIIKCKNTKRFRAMISEMLIHFGKDKKYSDVFVGVDINPESLV